MCRETLEGVFTLSMEVVRYRASSEHRREPSATAPDQDPMPSLQWKDMKWSFIRCLLTTLNIHSFDRTVFLWPFLAQRESLQINVINVKESFPVDMCLVDAKKRRW